MGRLLAGIVSLLLCSTGLQEEAWAQSVAALSADNIRIEAPEPVQALINTYFELPEEPLQNAVQRAAFVRNAQRDIRELLATDGYFSANVSLQTEKNGAVLQVKPGARTHVKQLFLIFTGDMAAAGEQRQQLQQQLREQWPLKKGDPFRSENWQQAKNSLVTSVVQSDYPGARLVYSQADVNPEQASARLIVVLDSGPACQFGELDISGLQRYDSTLIERFLTFEAGERYDREQLMRFQNRLQSLPHFSSVAVYSEPDLSDYEVPSIDEPAPPPRQIPVKVVVKEIKPRKLSVGVGYSSNNGARGELGVADHHFLGQNWDMHADLRLEQNRQTLSANIDTLPDEKGYVLSWGGGSEATEIEGLKTERHKVSLSRSRTLGNIERRDSLSWQFESQHPQGSERDINRALVLDWQWNKRTVEDPLAPNEGYVTQVRLGVASQAALSDQDFVRSYGRHQIWYPLSPRSTLHLRAEAGLTFADSRDGIPQEYLFRAGGTQSVRGYDYLSLGLQDGDATVGARAMATASVEYTYWLWQDWGAAVFTDVGDAASSWRQLDWRNGYGLGARWRSPVGPLALDVARGKHSDSIKLHFAILVAF